MTPRAQSDAIKQSQELADKCRNEKQKSILLCERARLSYELVTKPIMKMNSELQGESKKVAERARSLRKVR